MCSKMFLAQFQNFYYLFILTKDYLFLGFTDDLVKNASLLDQRFNESRLCDAIRFIADFLRITIVIFLPNSAVRHAAVYPQVVEDNDRIPIYLCYSKGYYKTVLQDHDFNTQIRVKV